MTPGVYLNLPEADYFAADAIGSSDLKKLLKNTADWWYTSTHNPHFEQPADTPSRILGRALHCLLLEGPEAYSERFSIEPDPKDWPNAARTVKDLRALLNDREVYFKSSDLKPDLIARAKEAGLKNMVWDLIAEQHLYNVEEKGMTPLTTVQDRCVRHMAELALQHEDIGPAIQTGLTEVSVFWHRPDDDSILYRARFDCLRPGFILDLKSMSNWQGRDVSQSVIKQITELEYDLQRVFYDEARAEFSRFVEKDIVFFGSEKAPLDHFDPTLDEQIGLLRTIAPRDTWQWVWLFYQVRDDKTGKAPILVPRMHSPEGQVYIEAQVAIEQAIANFKEYRNRFGLETPWHHAERLEELEDHHLANLQYKRSNVA